MFAPDLLHGVEIGTWKDIFIHLLRLIFAYDGSNVEELDRRYVTTSIFVYSFLI
jgi:hypothetical protein